MPAHIPPIHRPADAPPELRSAVEALFTTLMPGVDDPHFDEAHDGMALAAHNPAIAQALATLGSVTMDGKGFAAEADLREILAQVVNRHFGQSYAASTRHSAAHAAGLTDEHLSALATLTAAENPAFTARQRLVISYSRAVAANTVPDELTAQMIAEFGDAATVEATALVGFFAMWALFLNALRPG
jgi:alkylhydroperoxidase family enzyme